MGKHLICCRAIGLKSLVLLTVAFVFVLHAYAEAQNPLGAPANEVPASAGQADNQSEEAFIWHCSCSGNWSELFTPVPSSDVYGAPTSVAIDSIWVSGDLSEDSEYIDFRLSGQSSFTRYQGGADTSAYTQYSYGGQQPTLVENEEGQAGFSVDIQVPSGVNYAPAGMDPSAYWHLRINMTVTYDNGTVITLALGDSDTIATLGQGEQQKYSVSVSAADASRFSFLRIATRGGAGEVDLFVGKGFMPSPYQNYTCDSQSAGNNEVCDLASSSGNYYASVYAFRSSSNVEVYAQGLGVPDAPVATSAEAADLGANLVFDYPNANGSTITSYTARCELSNTLDSEVSARSNAPRIDALPSAKIPSRLSLPADAQAVQFSGELSDIVEGGSLLVTVFDETLRLTVARKKVTPNDNLYLEGSSAGGYPFRLLISPDGVIVGSVSTESDEFLISPSVERDAAVLRSITKGSLESVTLGDDMRVPEGDSAGMSAPTEAPPLATSSVIDVMFLYDGSLSSPVETIDYLLQYMNSVHRNSGTGATFQATSFRQYDKSSGGLPLSEIASSDQVRSWRDSDRADFVAWLGPYPGGGTCGVAYVPGTNGAEYAAQVKSAGFSTSYVGSYGSSFCADKTLPHEIGHNLGAVHERGNSSLSPYYPYAWGDGIDGLFGTIQSYQRPGVDFFSSPLLTCKGNPCGRANYTDVVRAIDNVRGVVSNIYAGDGAGTGVITITPAAGFGGTVSPSAPKKVATGDVATFTFTPDVGYELSSVSGSCAGVRDGNVYEVTAGSTDCRFEGSFAPTGKYYLVSISSDDKLTATPAGRLRVVPFDTFDVSVTKVAGYAVTSVETDCPGTYSGGVFSSGEIVSNCSLFLGSGVEGASANNKRSPILVEGLSPDQEYECSVSATNDYGAGPASNTLLVTPFLASAPGAPSNLRVVAEDGEALVYFTPGDTGRLDVTYTATCGGQSASSSGSPIRVSGLANGVAVDCTVTATNSKGSSASSEVIEVIPEELSGGLPIWLLYEASQP